jgi:hypothetical protein
MLEAGGPVIAGRPYIVGESRPELFVPRESGYVFPQVPASSGPSQNPGQSQVKVVVLNTSQQFQRFMEGAVGQKIITTHIDANRFGLGMET